MGDYRVAALVYAQTRVSCTMTLTHYRISDLAICKTSMFHVSIVSLATRAYVARETPL
jgi:hypothetical protein